MIYKKTKVIGFRGTIWDGTIMARVSDKVRSCVRVNTYNENIIWGFVKSVVRDQIDETTT